jgi:ribosomal protein S18 acetylase RimI-like enzyme
MIRHASLSDIDALRRIEKYWTEVQMIRNSSVNDLDSIVSIEKTFGADAFTKRCLRRFILSNNTFLVYEKGGDVIGYAIILFRLNSKQARLYSVAVAPQYRGLGYGKALVTSAIIAAVKRNMTAISLEVSLGNKSARSLYSTLGFTDVKTLPEYYKDGTSAIKMKKVIAK